MPLPTFFNLPETKRQRILNCAIEEFSEHDYNEASISKIVSRAGIAKGSLYQYFYDKRDLYNYLLELVSQKKGEMLKNVKATGASTTIFETLHVLFDLMITFEVQYTALAKIGDRALNGNAPIPEEIMLRAKQSTSQYFFQLIEEGKQRGEVRPEIDSRLAAYIFSSSLSGMSEYLRYRNPHDLAEDEIETAFNQMIVIFENGIANTHVERGKIE